MRQNYIASRLIEQAERMAAQWRTRAQAYHCDVFDGYGVLFAESFNSNDMHSCRTVYEAAAAERQAEKITDAIQRVRSGCGEWADVLVIYEAATEEQAAMTREITQTEAEAVLAFCPPDFTEDEWDTVRRVAFQEGEFMMAGQRYKINTAAVTGQ